MTDFDNNPLCYVAKSPVHGHGLFARDAIPAGVWIGHYDGPCTEENGTYVLWVDNGGEEQETWIGYDGINELKFLNHARLPNGEMDGLNLYAARAIKADEEITIDYGEEFDAGL